MSARVYSNHRLHRLFFCGLWCRSDFNPTVRSTRKVTPEAAGLSGRSLRTSAQKSSDFRAQVSGLPRTSHRTSAHKSPDFRAQVALVTDMGDAKHRLSPVLAGYSSGSALHAQTFAGVGQGPQIKICVNTGYGWISVTSVEYEAAR